eukprot:NODE_4607_length_764_cov_23.902669_g4448_i0.p1 GENE.NODE_4607_length_764_cov_23.902669_g4448_i0~~NODE_4607_length_764_cov_23.902669_g4448_i0.p1  ORF type:complete len:230 (-),score=78.46 NODE_4607_length_764_cov_23.902669_g4448_i0:74-709(-)
MPILITTTEAFAESTKADRVCVHFGAEWAAPCKDLDEVLDSFANEFPTVKFFKVDCEALADIAEQMGIESVPHVIFMQNGQVSAAVSGAKVPQIKAALNNLCSNLSDESVPLETRLKALLTRSPVMLFMKGEPAAPRCGFSNKMIQILDATGIPYDTFDILTNEEARQGLKVMSKWPTYPQLYVNGELVGGIDIVQELKEGGELMDTLNGV